jgi:hypothetical protein
MLVLRGIMPVALPTKGATFDHSSEVDTYYYYLVGPHVWVTTVAVQGVVLVNNNCCGARARTSGSDQPINEETRFTMTGRVLRVKKLIFSLPGHLERSPVANEVPSTMFVAQPSRLQGDTTVSRRAVKTAKS